MTFRPGCLACVPLLVGLSLGLLGCARTPGAQPSAEVARPAMGSWQVEFKAGDGQESFSLERTRDGIRLEDSSGNALVQLRPAPDGVAVADGRGQALGRVLPVAGDAPGLRALDRSGALLFQLVMEADGDFTLKNATGSTLYKAKQRDYGYKVVGRDGAVESRIRSKTGKTSVRDARGNTVLYTRDPMPTRAVAVLTLDQVPIEFAAGMAVAIVRGMVPR